MDNNSNNNSANNAAAPAAAKSPPGSSAKESVSAIDQRHLNEFNEWLARWIGYQGLLALYWKKRAQYEEQQSLAAGQGVVGGESKGEDKWDLRFQELCEYKHQYGDCNVPTGFVYKYKPPLGSWVKNMRRLEKVNKLDPEKVSRLTQIGFKFIHVEKDLIKLTPAWHDSYLQLKAYHDKHGNIEVPVGFTMPNGKRLDNWIARQRGLFTEGKLSPDLVKKLQSLDLNLKGRGRPFGLGSPEWNGVYKELVAYYEKHGDCDVPDVYAINPPLGVWVNRQRNLYNMGALSEDRLKKLTDIGFNIHQGKKKAAAPFDPWHTRMLELKAFKEANGHTDVPRSYALNHALALWTRNQRLAKINGTLSEEQIKALEDVGFNFTAKSSRPLTTVWDKKFAELAKYKAQNKSFKGIVAAKPDIGSWLKRQKQICKEKGLEKSRFDRLKELGVNLTDGFVAQPAAVVPWETMYEALVGYKNEAGDTNVPREYEPNPRLYQWVVNQRQKFKAGKLSEERFQLLSSIGFNFHAKERRSLNSKPAKGQGFLNPSEFDHYFQKLVEYKAENGHVNVPQRYSQDRLGTFTHYMRLYQKLGKLSSDKVSRLKEIGFVFDLAESLFNSRCEQLASYYEIHGNFFVTYAEDPALHQWKNNQIKRRKENNLPKELEDKLLAIGFDFVKYPPKTPKSKSVDGYSKSDPLIGLKVEPSQNREQYLQELWDVNYNKLAAIYEQRGNSDIPLKYEEDPSLGSWCFAQKIAKKKQKLSDERVEKLEMLGFKF